jgi:hypothetical protein
MRCRYGYAVWDGAILVLGWLIHELLNSLPFKQQLLDLQLFVLHPLSSHDDSKDYLLLYRRKA